MASTSVGENQLQRIIRDLRDAVLELIREHNECGEPITDDSSNLHKFSYKLEYLLQFDQKEKTTFLGQRKDYWDYFSDCLAKIKGANDGIRFVKSIPELKTSLGKGRAFIRYSLVHQRLADTLQQCLINHKVTSEWYYARSPFLKSHLTADIINHLYELNQVLFDVASRGHDLDADWPTFARRALGANSPAYPWKPPSRCSSINSLVSNYSHSQVAEFPPSLELAHSLLGDLGELGEPSDPRAELDRAELRQQALQAKAQASDLEAAELRAAVSDLRRRLAERQTCCHRAAPSEPNENREEAGRESASYLQLTADAVDGGSLRERLTTAENKNMELLNKLDGALSEKGLQTASYCDSAWKIQELIDRLKVAEEERLTAKREADDWARRAQKASQELKLREEETRRTEEKLAKVKAAARGEREEALRRLEELQGVVGRIEGALTLKEKEAGNLRSQLQDLQASLENRERQAEELKKKLREERRDMTWRSSAGNEVLESQLGDLREKLKNREKESAHSSERVRYLEALLEKLAVEKQHLNTGNEVFPIDQSKMLEDYKSQCTSLMEINAKLLQTVKRSEASNRELSESRAAMRDQLASLTASQNPLKVQEEATTLSIEERETKLLEANQRLEEVVHKALLQSEASDATLKRLERDNKEIMETQMSLKKQLASTQEYLDALAAKETEPGGQPLQFDGLRRPGGEATASGTTAKTDNEKSDAERSEKAQKLYGAHHAAFPDTSSKHLLTEAQLELNLREVTKLQDEVVELRAQLLAGAAERMKVQALQEVTESSREDLRVLVEQLKAQVEELNRRHVDEILHSREREDALGRERDGEARARDDLASELAASREQLRGLKQRHEAACAENAEAREALHRANTETAELGVHVCMLTAEKEEARLRWEALSARLRELEEEAAREAERLNGRMEELRRENRRLTERLAGTQETGEEETETEMEEEALLRNDGQEEVRALRIQISSQAMSHANLLKGVNEELQEARSQLGLAQERAALLESQVKQLEAENRRCGEQIEGKSAQMSQSQSLVQQRDEELNQMKGKLLRTAEGLAVAEKACGEMSERLRRANQEQQSRDGKMAAELDDLYRTKITLEERLIELIRDKDELWQKSDALEFEQKLREEETERDVNHCLDCHSQFSWWLRKYTCRLCGRPFCYYCCSNTVSTLQAGGAADNRERCCRHCYEQHSAVVERHPQDGAANAPHAPFSALPQPGDRAPAGDDGVFDIITEEEVSGVYDSDSLSFSTACSPGHGQQGAAQLSSGAGAQDPPAEEPEDATASPVQDAEICLLKAGELTLSVPYALDEVAAFGDAPRELFVRSSCYSAVPITVGGAGPTVTWVFTSEPKSISFSVVYRPDASAAPEDAKVLIPLTRCNSHKETIQGELKVRHAGEYTLVFDNSFSRFISKKVLYRLSVAKPVIYDGSDCP